MALINEMPRFTSASNTFTTYDAGARAQGLNISANAAQTANYTGDGEGGWAIGSVGGDMVRYMVRYNSTLAPPTNVNLFVQQGFNTPTVGEDEEEESEEMATASTTPPRRIVRVIISDPDPKVPVDHCVLYRGDEMITDQDDRELFLDMDIGTHLDKHNDYRKTVIDKDKSGKDIQVFLEPTRPSKLNMSVVTITPL